MVEGLGVVRTKKGGFGEFPFCACHFDARGWDVEGKEFANVGGVLTLCCKRVSMFWANVFPSRMSEVRFLSDGIGTSTVPTKAARNGGLFYFPIQTVLIHRDTFSAVRRYTLAQIDCEL
jgi:hypothetical protein